MSPEDFVAMKVFAGGSQDLVDAQQVLAVDAVKVDLQSLRLLRTRVVSPRISRGCAE